MMITCPPWWSMITQYLKYILSSIKSMVGDKGVDRIYCLSRFSLSMVIEMDEIHMCWGECGLLLHLRLCGACSADLVQCLLMISVSRRSSDNVCVIAIRSSEWFASAQLCKMSWLDFGLYICLSTILCFYRCGYGSMRLHASRVRKAVAVHLELYVSASSMLSLLIWVS